MKDKARDISLLLNSMLEADPVATHALIINRVPCTPAMAEHPSVVVDELGEGTGRFVVGLMGVLNGLLSGSDYVVAYEFDVATRSLLGFKVVERVTLKSEGPR